MGTFAVYGDVSDFLANGGANVETASLTGGNTTLSAAIAAGATTLPIASTAGFPVSGSFTLYLLDGMLSERVSASISGGALLAPGGVASAHAAGISLSSAGTGGCLADVLIRASRAIENYCRQGPAGGADRMLYAISRSETATGPSLRCAIDPDWQLIIRPWRWPIQTLSAATLQWGSTSGDALALAASAAIITTAARRVVVPLAQAISATPATLGGCALSRGASFSANWTYTAGPCLGPTLADVPDDLRQACYLLAADILTQRQNPYGLSESQQGKLRRSWRMRGDRWTTMLRERAFALLAPYAEDGWLEWP